MKLKTMKAMSRNLFALGLLLLVGACASPYPSAPETLARADEIRKVGVVSDLSDTLRLLYIHWLTNTEDVPTDWRISDRMAEMMESALRERYEVRRYDLQPKTTAATMSEASPQQSRSSDISARLRQIAAPGEVDVFVVVEPVNFNAGTLNPVLEGAYLQSLHGYSSVGLSYQMTVFDGRTFAPRASSPGLIPPSGATGTFRDGFVRAIVAANVGWTGQPYAQTSDATKTAVRVIVDNLLEHSVPTTLYRLGLGDSANVNVYMEPKDVPVQSTASLSGSRLATGPFTKDVRVIPVTIDGKSTMLTGGDFERKLVLPAGSHSVGIQANQEYATGQAILSVMIEAGRTYVIRTTALRGRPVAWIEDEASGAAVAPKTPMTIRRFVPAAPIFIPVPVK